MSPLAAGLEDLRAGFANWQLWGYLSWHDIRQRYRRSKLGPFWATASMAFHIACIGVVWGALFEMPAREFVPYLCAGMMVWSLILGCITEGCNTFVAATPFILQINRPLSVYAFWAFGRNLLMFAHTFPVYLAVVLLFHPPLNVHTLGVLGGLPLLALALSWSTLLLGLLTARFRDIQQIVQSLMTMFFLVTPILWRLDQLGDRRFLATLNPFTHLIDVVRAPLLGQSIPPAAVATCAAVAILGWGVTLPLFGRYRGRIAYWL